jgi:O-antigen/teichoic acid export membrane protein
MSEEQSLKEKTAKGLLWGGFSNGAQQLLNLLFGVMLARLLSPADYGMVGMLSIFSLIASSLQEGGFITALTNRKNVTQSDYSSVFWFNTCCSVTIYLLLFMAAPLIADFYSTPELVPLSRFCFLTFVVSSTNIVPRTILFKNLRTKDSSIITVGSLLLSGIAGVTLAYNGFAYWGIAIQNMVYVCTVTALSYYLSGWHPTFGFDARPIREMFGFSSRIIITNIFTILNNNIFTVLLGRFYSEQEVGNFTQANKWNTMGNSLISGMVASIAQPVLTTVVDDRQRQLNVFRKLLRFTAFVSFPAMFGLSIVAREFIVIAITDKWLASAEILRMLCVWGAFVPIATLFTNLLLSRGRSSSYMWSTVSLALIQLIAMCAVHDQGIRTMLTLYIIINIFWLMVWFSLVRREIGLTFLQMMKDIVPYVTVALVAVGAASLTAFSIPNLYLSLLIKVVVATAVYCLALWSLHSVIFREAINFFLKKKIG